MHTIGVHHFPWLTASGLFRLVLPQVPCAVQAAIALSTNKVLGRKRLAVAYLTEYPTDEVLARWGIASVLRA